MLLPKPKNKKYMSKIVFIENKKQKHLPECFYFVCNLYIEGLDSLFGFQTEPYSFDFDFGKENGTILDYESTDRILKNKFTEEYWKQAKEMTTDELRNLFNKDEN